MKRLFWALLALILVLPVAAPAAVRLDTNSDNIDFGDNFDADTAFALCIIFRTQAGEPNNARVFSKNITASGRRGWGLKVKSGSTRALSLDWFRADGGAGSNQGGSGDVSGANDTGTITDGVWYQVFIVYDPAQPGGAGNANADSKVRIFKNGTEVVDATGQSIGYLITGAAGIPNTATDGSGSAVNFTLGKDAGSATNNGALFDVAELEFYQGTVSSPSQKASDLYNNGNFKRMQDIGIAVSTYHDFFTRSLSSFTDKAGGGKGGTGTGLAQGGASTTYIVHPPMGEPIAEFTAATGVYDNNSGGSEPANNGKVGRWEDQSGRQLHLTVDESVSSGANCPKYRKAAGDYARSIFFDKFPDSSAGDTESAAWLAMPADTRFDSSNYSVLAVVDSMGTKNEYNPTSSNTADRTFLTLWCNDDQSGGRFTYSRESGNGALSSGVASSGIVRSEATLMDSGGGQSTPSAYLYAPVSPTFIAHLTNSSTTKKQAAIVQDGAIGNVKTTTTAMTAVATSGTFTIGYNPYASGGLAAWNFNGGFYRLEIFNRTLGSLDAGSEDSIGNSRLNESRTTWANDGIIDLTPTALVFFHGSSTTEGQAASYGRNLPYLLWHRESYYRGCWIYNWGSKRAQANADVTSGNMNIPSFENHAADTSDIVAGRFTYPKEHWYWGGINDIMVGSRTNDQLFSDTLSYMRNRKAAVGSRVGSASYPKVVVIELWRNTDTNGSEGTYVDAYNHKIEKSPYAGRLWNYYVPWTGTDLADMAAAAANEETDDDKHPNETGFEAIYAQVAEYVINEAGKLTGQSFDRNRNRPLRVR